MSTLKVGAIRGVSGSSDAITVANDGTCTANITNNLSNRNLMINGAMQVAQRGTSFTNISNTGVIGSVDRIVMVGANLDELAFAGKQTSDGPDGFSNCFEFDVTTPENALDANDLVYMRYKVEGQDLTPFFNANGTGKNFILSFYVKAYQAGTYQLNIYKNQGPRFISKTYAIASSGVWQRIEIPFTGDTGTSGINDDNGNGFQIAWMLAAGTDYTSAGVLPNWGGWPGNSGFAGGHAVNVASSANNYWRITGIQLELDQGSGKATDFEHRSFADELRRCQRYFFNVKGDNQHRTNIPAFANSATNVRAMIQFPVPMRATPTFSGSSTNMVFDSSDDSDLFQCSEFQAGGSLTNDSPHGMLIEANPGGMTAGQAGVLEFRADNGVLNFAAEL